MTDIFLSNAFTRKKEKFIPLTNKKVGIYSCGPTVYWNQHIGHMYAYVQWDILVRLFRYLGYEAKWVMNITDVGHMTGENEGNPDVGEDKMEKGAKREGLSVWQLAEKYIKQFEESVKALNITKPDVMPRATEHIKEQINLAKKIQENGYAYLTDRGLIFDTSKFKGYAKFANLVLDAQKVRDDVEDDPQKKRPWDFFLWVKNDKHLMKWKSPWGVGYPGWHLECTAMSTKYLGDKFDVHTGGIDHIAVHHTNEIAQGYGAFGGKTANYWLHNAHLTGKTGEKMSKSLGNFVTVQDLIKKRVDPLSLRYLFLTSHYRKGMNFSLKALAAADTAYKKLKNTLVSLRLSEISRETLSPDKLEKIEKFRSGFIEALCDDINTPKAMSVVWEAIKSNVPSGDKYDLITSFDEILGLKLYETAKSEVKISKDVAVLLEKREELRSQKKFVEADQVRKEIEGRGYLLEDSAEGVKLVYKDLKNPQKL